MTIPVVAGGQTKTRSGVRARIRFVALCAAYALLSLWALVMSFFGTLMVVLDRLPDASWTFGALAAAAFKVLTLGPALIVLASRGRSVLAVRALVAGQLVWFVVDLLAPEEPISLPERLLRGMVSLTLWVGPWVLLSDHRAGLWRDPLQVRRPLLAFPLVVGVACVPWVVANRVLDATVHTSMGTSAELRYDVVGVPVVIVAAMTVCAVAGASWWHRLVVIALVWVAGASLVSPDGYGSPGYAGCLFAVVAALLLWATRPRGGMLERGAVA